MSDELFQWSFIGVIILAIILIVVAAIKIIPLWVIAIAIVGGIVGNGALLWFWGRDYMERHP